ncbi:hypothetical protein F4553_000866 [Allocatelliglobosispora scoriae]|uniref:Uncharacterized protein n=1 Tax=Allocatelliglobosispora scoriae TaxID=643052 RepID=A0A841BEH3_9ACTN|nr:hypothetical protein [Allocatelliglobosispora scoriae]MBB5867487.1 hypothetical protein [Allocatelliglobosispora scoriae]
MIGTMSGKLTSGRPAESSTVTVVVCAPAGLPGYRAIFEPEGSTRDMAPGDSVTVEFAGGGPKTIEVYPFEGGLVIWRPLDVPYEDIVVTDQAGNRVEDIY